MASLSEPDVRAFLSQGTRTGKLALDRAATAGRWSPRSGSCSRATARTARWCSTPAPTPPRAGRSPATPRVSLCVDLEEPPFAFVQVQGTVTLSADPDELLRTATELGGRYMGADRAEEFGRRNAVPGELVVRLVPTKVVAALDMTA